MLPFVSSVPQDTYAHLLCLKDKLSALQIVSCGMVHEQAKSIKEDTLTPHADIDALGVVRRGLCNNAQRRNFLGCAHTVANDNFTNITNELFSLGIFPHAQSPTENIKQIVFSIYMLDHEKGILEKRLALAKHLQHTEEEHVLQQTINEVVSRHQVAINSLKQEYSAVMLQLQTAIEKF